MYRIWEAATKVAQQLNVGLGGTEFHPEIASHRCTLDDAVRRILDSMKPTERLLLFLEIVDEVDHRLHGHFESNALAHYGYLDDKCLGILYGVVSKLAAAIQQVGRRTAEERFEELIEKHRTSLKVA